MLLRRTIRRLGVLTAVATFLYSCPGALVIVKSPQNRPRESPPTLSRTAEAHGTKDGGTLPETARSLRKISLLPEASTTR